MKILYKFPNEKKGKKTEPRRKFRKSAFFPFAL